MPKLKISKDAETIAKYCEETAVQLIQIAAGIRRGADPEQITAWDNDDTDTYTLECYNALTELLADDHLITREGA
jgi:hypothetical protein